MWNVTNSIRAVYNFNTWNLLSLVTTNEKAINTVYNVAYGDRNTLNDLMGYLKEYLSEFIAFSLVVTRLNKFACITLSMYVKSLE